MLLPYVLFVFLYVGSNLSFRSLRTGSQVFAFYVVSLCDFAYYVFGVRACNCYTSFPLVCCACLPSV